MGGRSSNKKVNKGKNFNMVNGVRIALEDEEKYAVCIKVFGGGMCSVKCEDGVTRSCIMRSKFRGRDRKNNFLSQGTLVLVGLREWERVPEGKPEKCDLLEVYNVQERDNLLQLEKRDLTSLGISISGGVEDTDFDFVDDKTMSYRQMIERLSDDENDSSDEDNGVVGSGEAVNIDDI